MESLEKRVDDFKRSELEKLLNDCTEPQRAFFDRIFPEGVPEEKLDTAIKLCERTVSKNVSNLMA